MRLAKKICVYALIAFCLFLALGFASFQLGKRLEIGSVYDPEISRTYEDIFRGTQSYNMQRKPQIKRMRFPFTILSALPITSGYLDGEVRGYFDPNRNLIVVRKHGGTFGYEGGIIAHELGHAVGWNAFCTMYTDCNRKIGEYYLSEFGSEGFANETGEDIADTVSALRMNEIQKMKLQEQLK